VELKWGRNEPLLPGFSVTSLANMQRAYDISSDSHQVIASVLDRQGKSKLWLLPLDRSAPPRQIPNVQGDMPLFGPYQQILFRGFEGALAYIYRVNQDGSNLEKVIERPIAALVGISPDGHWLVAKIPGKQGSSTELFPIVGGAPVKITANGAFGLLDNNVQWSADGRQVFITVNTNANSPEVGRTHVCSFIATGATFASASGRRPSFRGRDREAGGRAVD
jgi:hypothetical protein